MSTAFVCGPGKQAIGNRSSSESVQHTRVLSSRVLIFSWELDTEVGEELLLAGKRILWCAVRTHASPALCAHPVPTRNKDNGIVFCVEAHRTLELGDSPRLVYGNCLTVVAQRHSVAAQHRAVMGIKRRPVERPVEHACVKHLAPLATDYWAASHSFVEPGHSVDIVAFARSLKK